jgi:hypothetical protein
MEKPMDADAQTNSLTLQLSKSDFAILEKFRGDLSPDAFISALLRMIDSGAVASTPDWVKEKDRQQQ